MALTKVTSGVIAANAVVDSFGTQSLTGDKYGLTSINANNIVNASITGDKIGVGQITANLFASGAVSTTSISNGNSNVSIASANSNVSIFAAGTERVRVVTNGDVGVGKNLPTAKLDVQRTSGTTQPIGQFTAAVGSYTGTSLVAQNTLGPDSAYNLLSCITDSDGDVGGPYTEFYVRGDGLVFMDSGYGSAAAAYGCRAWVNFNGTGTPAIREDGNVSSITDNDTGQYTINFTTAMPDVNYAFLGTVNYANTNGAGGQIISAPSGTLTVSAIRVACINDAGTYFDQEYVYGAIFR